MNIDRLKELEKFRQNDPNDPFLIYAIAMECKEEDPQRTEEYFNILLNDHEEYVGTYYHAAKLYVSLGKYARAEEIFLKGILIAEKINDEHALRELKSAYNEFLFEKDEE